MAIHLGGYYTAIIFGLSDILSIIRAGYPAVLDDIMSILIDREGGQKVFYFYMLIDLLCPTRRCQCELCQAPYN